MNNIKDPIHGYIDVSDDDLSIINSRSFQRLRHINQLGLCSAVYPSANHSRFSHSLGVMHLADQLSSSISLKEDRRRESMIAGLLHDVGHLPFSHTLEPILKDRAGIEHEDLSCQVISNMSENSSISLGAEPSKLKDIIKGRYDGLNIINSEIDCDRLDYLLRDSYNTGIQLGTIELDTLIKFAKKMNNRLGFNHKALRSVERILDARMEMRYSVYRHNTVTIAETMLRRCVEFHLDNSDDKIEDYVNLTDGDLRQKLSKTKSDASAYIFDRIDRRHLYKTSYQDNLENIEQTTLNELSNTFRQKREIESEIADMADIPKHKVLVDLPKTIDKSRFKTPIEMPYGWRELEDISAKPQSLRRSHVMNQKIHVFTPKDVDVSDESEAYFNSLL